MWKLLVTAGLAACSITVQAAGATLIDTGSGEQYLPIPNHVFANQYEDGYDWYAVGGRFTLTNAVTLGSVAVYMNWIDDDGRGGTGPLSVSILRADGEGWAYGSGEPVSGVPGSVMFTNTYQRAGTSTAQWQTFSAPVMLDPGDYWIYVTDVDSVDGFRGRLPSGAPRPLDRYVAYISDAFSVGWYESPGAGFGFRVSEVPELSTLALWASAAPLMAWLARRRDPKGPTRN